MNYRKMQRAGLFYEQQQRDKELEEQRNYLQSLMGSRVVSEDSITTPPPSPLTDKPTAPINPIQEGIDKGIIEGHKDYDSSQEWYDHMTKKPTYSDPATPRNWQQKLGIGIMGIRTLLSEIGGRVARGRQNQYDYMQQTALGQMNPMPSSLFNQPGDTTNLYAEQGGINPYSQYAKYGGKLKFQTGGKAPIYTSDKNDPRLKPYGDSSRLYNNYLDVKQKLQNSNYKQTGAGTSSYDKSVDNALKSQVLFGLKQEDENMYSVDDLVPWQINKALGRQLISTKIKPAGVEFYAGNASGNNVYTWKSNEKGSGNKARYSDNGRYENNPNEMVSDLRSIANYSNVKPQQPIIYQEPTPPVNKPVTAPRPKRTGPLAKIPVNTADMSLGDRPEVGMPQMPEMHDPKKPTSYSYTTQGEGYNEQNVAYLPDQKTWEDFVKNRKGLLSSQQGEGYGTATGYRYGGLTHAKFYGPKFSNGANFKFSEEERFDRSIAKKVANKLFKKMGF